MKTWFEFFVKLEEDSKLLAQALDEIEVYEKTGVLHDGVVRTQVDAVSVEYKTQHIYIMPVCNHINSIAAKKWQQQYKIETES